MAGYTEYLKLFKYNPETDSEHEFSINQALNENWDKLDAFAESSGRNIGEIITSTIPLTDAGLHLLDGSLISGDGIYSEFVEYMANLYGDGTNIPNYFTDEESWQNSILTYKVCGKFVYDFVNNTIRLPKINGILEGTTDVSALGNLIEAGLPEITGQVYGGITQSCMAYISTGAFSSLTTSSSHKYPNQSNSVGNGNGFIFNASNSNSIYGNSSTVQPQTVKVFVYIVISTTIKTSIEVDINKIVTSLNGKADTDLSNCTKPYVIETYQTGESGYFLYSNGYCIQWFFVTGIGVSDQSQTITFLKQFKDTNYKVIIGSLRGSYNANYLNLITEAPGYRTTSGTTFWGSVDRDLMVCGYVS